MDSRLYAKIHVLKVVAYRRFLNSSIQIIGLRFRVQVSGLRFRASGLRFTVLVQGLRFRV